MATYRFEPFNIDIVDPVITANVNTIGVQAEFMTINVLINLENPGVKMRAYNLTEISVQNLTYQDYNNLMERVMERLQDFLI